MNPAAATAATLALFFAPGLLFVTALAGARKRVELTLGEQAYLVLAASLLVSGWAGLVLAELGVFTPGRLAVSVAGATLLAAVAARKRLQFAPGRLPLSEVLALAGLVGFALLVYFPPFEYVLGGKDPGVYVNAGFHLAREGNLTWSDPLVRDLPPEARGLFFRTDKELPPWAHSRFLGYYLESPETGRTVSQGFHLYPVWIAIAASLFEMKAGLYATPFFALLGLLGVFFAARRIFGLEVALWAAALLGVFQIQIWFARFPNTEILVQFLYALSLLAFHFMREERSRPFAALAGAALGSTFLVRIDTILFLVPLALYFGGLRFSRRLGRVEAWCLGVLGVLLIHAMLHGRLVSGPYVASVFGRWYWRDVGENLIPLAAGAVVLFLLIDRQAAPFVARTLRLGEHPLAGRLAAAALFLLAAYAYFVRPVWHYYRTAPHDAEAFFRMSWYLYPMGVALAVAGAMLLVGRAEGRTALFLLAGLTFSLFFFYKIRVSNDHFFCMRRFVPVILPSFFVASGVFLATLRSQGGRWGRLAAAAVGGLLWLVYLQDGRPLWRHMEFRGSLEFVDQVARLIGDRDVVLFPRREGLHLLELPLAELYGKKVLEFYSLRPEKAKLASLLRSWSGRVGDVYFVTNYKISLSGLFTRQVQDFELGTEKYEFTYDRPPRQVEPFHLRFTLSKAVDLEDLARRVPRLARVDVGGSDDPLVAWFHEKEREEGGEPSYRWSQATSSVFLPGLAPASREIWIHMAGPKEPLAPRARVEIALNDRPLAEFTLGPRFKTYRVLLPSPPVAPGELAVLRLDSPTWRPASSLPGARDIRELGVRVDWIEVR
jgi:hypothetical protein